MVRQKKGRSGPGRRGCPRSRARGRHHRLGRGPCSDRLRRRHERGRDGALRLRVRRSRRQRDERRGARRPRGRAHLGVALAVVLASAVVLVVDRFPPVLVLGGAVGVLLFADVIDSDVALSGLSSPAPATIASARPAMLRATSRAASSAADTPDHRRSASRSRSSDTHFQQTAIFTTVASGSVRCA